MLPNFSLSYIFYFTKEMFSTSCSLSSLSPKAVCKVRFVIWYGRALPDDVDSKSSVVHIIFYIFIFYSLGGVSIPIWPAEVWSRYTDGHAPRIQQVLPHHERPLQISLVLWWCNLKLPFWDSGGTSIIIEVGSGWQQVIYLPFFLL